MPFSLPSSPREIPLYYPARRWLFHKKMSWCIPVKNNLFPGFVPSTEETETDLSHFLISLHLDTGHFILSHFSFYSASFLAPGVDCCRGQMDRELVHSSVRWMSNSLLPDFAEQVCVVPCSSKMGLVQLHYTKTVLQIQQWLRCLCCKIPGV